jgi:predicted RNA-binding protein with PUA-like domain
MTRYWLMKCEPGAYTIDDLKRDGRTSWEGVRNYQARNFMRDDMQVGDGLGRVAKMEPQRTQRPLR